MCLIVIATKLSQPFDELVRHPVDDSDPTVLKINWRLWRQSMRGKHMEGFKRGEEVMVTDADVLEMDGKKIDDYLDWYQRTWIDDRPDKSMYPFCLSIRVH
jgi:RNA polymerase I-specific transcription initiation factor RRN7